MRQSIILGMSVLMLSACLGGKQSSETQKEAAALALPVSEKQLCLDWYTAFGDALPDYDEELPKPNQYIVTDIDHDGTAEVLMQGDDTNKAAMLSYNKDGEINFSDVTNDGYLCLGIGDGWYVREFDDHMNEFRTFTKYYYKVEDGMFTFIGERETGFDGIDEAGEFIPKESDNTGGKAPADSVITMYYDMANWKVISDDAKAAALTALEEGGEEAEFVEDDMEENETHAGEVTLENGTRFRVDYMQTPSKYITGYTTYYRSNGQTSIIPFFGTKYFDKSMGQNYIDVYEHYNGKCCGHMIWSLNDNNELISGSWFIGEKNSSFDTFKVVDADPDAEFTGPSLDFKVADKLMPCDRETMKKLFAQTYPESGPANYFMLVDIDSNGSFESLVVNGFADVAKIALVWKEGNEAKIMGFGKNHNVSVQSSALFVKSDDGKSLYRWADGKPCLATDTSPEEMEYFEQNAMDLSASGEWLSL